MMLNILIFTKQKQKTLNKLNIGDDIANEIPDVLARRSAFLDFMYNNTIWGVRRVKVDTNTK